jgi:hypothetical protein
MLTPTRVNKIIDIVAKDYPQIKNKPIKVTIQRGREAWACATSNSDYELLISKVYGLEIGNNSNFAEMFLPYMDDTFKLDLTWFLADFQSALDAVVLIHELGHVIQTSEIDFKKGNNWRNYATKMNSAYEDYRETCFENNYNYLERAIAYRQIPYEYESDRIASEMFNKYAVRLMSIISGKTQKELKAIREKKMDELQDELQEA